MLSPVFVRLYIISIHFLVVLVDVIKRRWKNLRDGMVRCLKKLDHSQHPGSGYLKTPMCRLFNELLFLRDCVQCTNTSMNLSDTEENLVGSATTPQLVEAPPKKRARHNVELSQDKNTSVVEKSTEKLDVYLTDGLTNGFTLDKPDVESSDWLFCRSLVGILEKMPSKNNRKARIEILQVLMKYEFQEDLSDEVDVEEGGEEGVQPEVVEEVERLE